MSGLTRDVGVSVDVANYTGCVHSRCNTKAVAHSVTQDLAHGTEDLFTTTCAYLPVCRSTSAV
jgi:hypothetical protein